MSKYCLTILDNEIISPVKPCTGKELPGHGVIIFSHEQQERLEAIAGSFKVSKKKVDVPTKQIALAIKNHFELGETKLAAEMIKRYYNVSLCCTTAIEQFINNLCL